MPRTHAAVVGQNAEHEKTREETSSTHPHKKGAAQAAEGRIRELKSSNATVSPAAAAANNSAAATAARQRDNQRALDEKRKERWKSAERSEKREREREKHDPEYGSLAISTRFQNLCLRSC